MHIRDLLYQWTEIWNTVNLWCSKFDGFYGSYQTMKWNISLNLHSHEKNCKFSSIDKEMLSMNLNEFRIQLKNTKIVQRKNYWDIKTGLHQ